MNLDQRLKIIPIGGIGGVTKNMYLYEWEGQILIVDCGIGFPEADMHGVDVLIPDISYLRDKTDQIVGMLLTHAHDDHIAALPYILPDLPEDMPIFGSKLTIGFAADRLKEHPINKEFSLFPDDGVLEMGPFQIESVKVTHSVPDARHFAIHTPAGTIYHGSDFKFDLTPVDGVVSDYQKMARIGSEGVLCLLSDCLRSEKDVHSKSESTISDTFEREIKGVEGKFIITSMSSNIHRIQQAVDVAVANKRKVAFLGRSIEQNIKTATRLGYFNAPENMIINKRSIDKFPPEEICVIIAGSQGQPGSSLSRAAQGGHTLVDIKPEDKVVFSSEPIPGNEDNVYTAIDNISKIGADVIYSDLHDNLHVSGHASAIEQKLLMELIKPKFLLPIGGTYRHMVRYRQLAQEMNFDPKTVFLLKDGQTLSLDQNTARLGNKISLTHIMVDGIGIGDIGSVVLNDRKAMGEAGMIVVVVPVDQNSELIGNISVVSRGFVFVKHAGELIADLEKTATNAFLNNYQSVDKPSTLRRRIEAAVADQVYKRTERHPLILVTVVNA